MRAISFAAEARIHDIDEETYKAIKQSAFRISIVSKERITDELNRILLLTNLPIGLILPG